MAWRTAFGRIVRDMWQLGRHWYWGLTRVQRRVVTGVVLAQTAVLLMAFTVPRKAVILPVGKDMDRAYQLLAETETGRQIIRSIGRAANGSYIYLTLGDTESDELWDERGRIVRGLTRAEIDWAKGDMVSRVTVITNRDLTGACPEEIVKSLAFELENVRHLYANSGRVRSGSDSPRAAATQMSVIRELGIL